MSASSNPSVPSLEVEDAVTGAEGSAATRSKKPGPEKVEFNQEQLGGWAREVEESLFKRLKYRPAVPLEDSPILLATLAYAVRNRAFDKLAPLRGDFLRDLVHYTPAAPGDLADGLVAAVLVTPQDTAGWRPRLGKRELGIALCILAFILYQAVDSLAGRAFPTLAEARDWLVGAGRWLIVPFNGLHVAGLLALSFGFVALVERSTRGARHIATLEAGVMGARQVLYARLRFPDQVRSMRWGRLAMGLVHVAPWGFLAFLGGGVGWWGASECVERLYAAGEWPAVAWQLMAGLAGFVLGGLAASLLLSGGQDALNESFASLEQLIERVRQDAVLRERIVEVAPPVAAGRKGDEDEG